MLQSLSIMSCCNVFLFTVCKWVTGSISRAHHATVEYYEFFPLVCLMSNYEADEELSKTCVTTLAMMGRAMTLPQHVPVVLHSASKVSERLYWHAIIMLAVVGQCAAFCQQGKWLITCTDMGVTVWAMMGEYLTLLQHIPVAGLCQ
jgi:hypothetical protein